MKAGAGPVQQAGGREHRWHHLSHVRREDHFAGGEGVFRISWIGGLYATWGTQFFGDVAHFLQVCFPFRVFRFVAFLWQSGGLVVGRVQHFFMHQCHTAPESDETQDI